MVFLRLTVKVLPREQVDQDSRSTVTPNGTSNGVDPAAATPGKTIIFQLPIRDPDSITLARLAALIQEKWKLLRPYSPPLDIKKILDAEKPKENLTVDLTVADVFVEHGKAALDGQDQHGTVLVIQNPTAEPVFEREESVVQDWSAAAATSYNLYKQQSEHLRRPNSNIATIVEEEISVRSVLNSVEPPEADVQLVPFDDNHGDAEMDDFPNGATNNQVKEKNTQMQIELATKDAVNGGIQSEVAPATQDDGTDELFANSVEHQESRESVDSRLSPSSDSSSYDDEDEDGVPFCAREASEELGMSPTPTARSASPRQSVSLNGVHKTNEGDEVTPAQPEKTFTPVEPSATDGPATAVTQTTDKNETPLDRNGNLGQEVQQNNVAKPDVPQASSQITSAVLPSGRKLQLDHPRAPSTPPSNRVDRYEDKSPLSERDRAHSVQRRLFSSPPKPLEFPDENRPGGSLGLGITGSPSGDRSRPSYAITDAAKTNKLTLSVNEKTSPHPPAYGTPPQSGGSHIRSSSLRSALRKTSPNHGSEMRRSVSFADDEKPSLASSSSTKKNKKKKKGKLPSETSPNPKSQSLPQSSNSPKPMAIVYPPDVPKERIEQYKAEIEMKKKIASQDTSGGTKRKSPGEHSTEKSKRAKRENSSSLAREQSAVAMSAKSNPRPKPVVHHAHGKAISPAQVTNPKAASDSESESESDEDIDKELFKNASQPAPKLNSVFASQSSAWTPINILRHDFASIRRARQKEREALGLQAKNPDGSEKSNGKAMPAKKDSAGNGAEWNNKDIFQITTSEDESSSDDTSDDDHGDILPNGKSRSLQASKPRA